MIGEIMFVAQMIRPQWALVRMKTTGGIETDRSRSIRYTFQTISYSILMWCIYVYSAVIVRPIVPFVLVIQFLFMVEARAELIVGVRMIYLLKAFKLLVFATILSSLSGSPIPCPRHKNIEVKIYCSNNLSDALDLICGGKFYSLSDKFPDTMGTSSSTSKLYETLRKKQMPTDYYQPLSNGTIHECCRRPCGYTELKLYCASDSD